MISPSMLQAQLPYTLQETELPGLSLLQRGKVRDVYAHRDDRRLIVVTTDRQSAFDRILTTLPFKGEVVNRLAAFWFEQTQALAPNHLLDVPDPNVAVVRRCRPLPIELVIRGYLTGSLWRDYQAGKANASYGIDLPPGLRRNQRLENPLITPSTKAEVGQHDRPLTPDEIIDRGLVPPSIWWKACDLAQELFARGQALASARGLILVDTKYEFGLDGEELLVIDEIHTPECSRYWVAEGAAERFAHGKEQRMLDKENIRQWLLEKHAFSGEGTPPAIPDEQRLAWAEVYLKAFERITGKTLEGEVGPVGPRIEANLAAAGYL